MQATDKLKTAEIIIMRSRKASMTEWVLPIHTNALGTIFGGVVMSWIDVVGVTAAQRYARAAVVTLCMDHVQFLAPIKIGYTVSLEAEVIHVGKTSLDVAVEVAAENTITGQRFRAATAFVTYVALDSENRPTPVPPYQPEDEEGREKSRAAEDRKLQRRRSRA